MALLVLAAAGGTAAQESQPAVVQRNLECPKGCLDRGNCNAELGQCMCPWGYAGARLRKLPPAAGLEPPLAASQLLPSSCLHRHTAMVAVTLPPGLLLQLVILLSSAGS